MTDNATPTDTQSAAAKRPEASLNWRNLYFPLYGIFGLLLLQALVSASGFLIPVITAFLGYFVLNRPRRWLQRIGVPPVASAALFTTFMAMMIFILLVQLSSPAAQFIEDLPSLVDEIKQKIAGTGGALEALNDASEAAEEVMADQEANTVEVEVVSDTGFVATVLSMAPSFLSRVGFALVLLFFLVASGDMFLTKTLESLKSFSDKRQAVEVLHSIEERLGYYLGGIAIINAGLGIAVAVAMYLWQIPGALIFGFMAFGLNFVPFLGGLMGAVIAAAVAFVSLNGTWAAAGVFATYIVLTSIEGQFITPLVISRRMRLNTTVVFLSVAFFAWIWSIMGMVVALPILIVIKIACDETGTFLTLARFLGDSEDYANDTEKG
ncbi:AI-2E family transporter [Sulfitobacter sp. F26169L]|uniref:AI-2E family transporter n=1 Tax=Sulfitobacter sp. F26169L TaxID=2996015 RepID=UPI0022608BDA|nr:AI-2E family transporter [Sulfitobacter sp. F26169L]MCX7567719.1 AI-2E family transporter [Sulfitobacter sp. F26169L]